MIIPTTMTKEKQGSLLSSFHIQNWMGKLVRVAFRNRWFVVKLEVCFSTKLMGPEDIIYEINLYLGRICHLEYMCWQQTNSGSSLDLYLLEKDWTLDNQEFLKQIINTMGRLIEKQDYKQKSKYNICNEKCKQKQERLA